MDHEDLKSHMDGRFDELKETVHQVGSKVDKIIPQVATNKEAISWIKGHLKTRDAFYIAIIGALVAAYFTLH